MRIIKSLAFIFFLAIPVLLNGQEKLVELELNPEIQKKIKAGLPLLKNYLITDTLELPFFDDFSKYTIYPSAERWEDQNVFVNMGFGVNPPTLGVATFDVLDSAGMMYDRVSTFSFTSDYLTSKPINLQGAGNDVYLSFYFQPMGNGDYPDSADSLVLEFFSPDSASWNRVWSKEGVPGKIDIAPPFKHIILPILEEEYLKKGFKFRFFNS